MKNFKKLLSAILCFAIIIGCFASIPVSALTYPAMGEIASSSGSTSIYSLPGTYGHETAENKYQSQKIDTLTNGTQVKVLGIEKDGDGDPWYKINYGENFAKSGYAFVSRVCVKYEYAFDADFEENLKNFPESYHNALRRLHAKYPNWKFVANDLDLTFKEAVEAQYGVDDVTNTRKWVEFTYGANEWRDMRAYNASTDSWLTLESRWTYASRVAIEYFMDPRNSLNEDMIFAFMQQSYQEDSDKQDNLRAIIKGTFLENGYDKDGDKVADKDAYIEDLIAAAKESKVSPYVLAATIIVEQGVNGTSDLISGTYEGFTGYYNFFNFSAAGSTEKEIIENGLAYAKSSGWNSRTAAITGGAKKYADGYISVGQDTYYYKDFNVIKEYWSHQYASALYDAWTNASYLKKGCITNSDAAITFSIPVYKDMPERSCIIPSARIETDMGYYEWRIDGTTLIISGVGDMGIISPWLDYEGEITDVIIEDGITGIGNFSFSNIETLTNVSIADSVTKIGESAFAYCSSLANIEIPDSVETIGERAFYYCTAFTDITLPDSITSIGEYAFYGCWNLENITLSKNLKTIDAHVFEGCERLKSIILPLSVTTVSTEAFKNCIKLTDVWYAGSESDREKITISSSSAGNNYLEYTATWHYNVCDVHTYLSDCDTVCENCDWIRDALAEHTYVDNSCRRCGETREAAEYEWSINVTKTGVYALKPNENYIGNFSIENIAVYDKNGKEVYYYEKLGGFPLVADQEYTVKFRYDCSDEISGEIEWNLNLVTEKIFPDVYTGEWYNDAITYALGRNIMSGYGSTGLFGTADNIQRQDFMVMLARLDGVDLSKYVNKTSPFSDVPNSSDCYYKAAVIWGYENGIVSGYANGKFGTGDKITREQLVKFLYNYANYKGLDTNYSAATKQTVKNKYKDYKNVSDWAQDAVLWAIENNVIKGKTDTTIVPYGNALRCEVAQIMYNIFLNDLF